LSRYLRCLSWSIPTMTLYVIGDTWPVTIGESTYVFVVLFFGVALQGFLVGNVMAVLSKDPRSAFISEQAEKLSNHLLQQGAKSELIEKVSRFMGLLETDRMQSMLSERQTIAELPYSLQVSSGRYDTSSDKMRC
jgi:hypothetical protein